MVQFSSQMFVRVSDEEKYGGLLFCQLREKGVFILEGLPCYLTTSHTDEDIDFVINAVKEAVAFSVSVVNSFDVGFVCQHQLRK